MEYNDNFVLPPKTIIQKMQKEYKLIKQKVNTQNIEILNIVKDGLNKLLNSYNFLVNYEKVSAYEIKNQLTPLVKEEKKEIESFKKYYPNYEHHNKMPYIPKYNKIKYQIKQEVIVIKTLLKLLKLEKNPAKKNLLHKIIDNRLNTILKLIEYC